MEKQQGARHVFRTLRIPSGLLMVVLLVPTARAADRTFYEQYVAARGITIKAPRGVSAEALTVARSIVVNMLAHRPDVAARMRARHAALAIIPRRSFITALPEFARLSGTKDPRGNPYDSFAVRGAGGVADQPVTATSEENLLGVEPDPFAAEDIARHEFAHAIMNLGFDDGERARWRAIYTAAKRRQPFPGAFAMTDADEYWAELSQSYFGVNNEINGWRLVAERDPEAAGFLEAVYGPPIPPPGDARPAPATGPSPVRGP